MQLVLTAALATLIAGLIALERQKRLIELPWLAKLGDWSYALYLIHVPIIVATVKVIQPFYRGEWLIFGCMAMAVLAASVVGRVDVALYRFLKRFFDNKPFAQRVGLTGFLAVFLSSALLAWLVTHP